MTSVRVTDDVGENVKQLFLHFLQEFTIDLDEQTSGIASQRGGQRAYPVYHKRALDMARDAISTLEVDFAHVIAYDNQISVSLSQTILGDYFRLKPFLEAAVSSFMQMRVADEPHGGHVEDKHYFVSFYHLDGNVGSIRELKTSRIGQLMSINGTVTRTSQVRPELLTAAFQCTDCRVIQQHIRQQFKYTEPSMCLNPVCENRSNWHLLNAQSEFVDWQMIRLQENPTEIPPGSMPRTMKVIMRSDIVDKAKPGDKCVITGCLIVVPDISQLARGGSVRVKNKGASRDTGYRGVSGLKELGVRDLTYKMCFLACAVQTVNATLETNDNEDDEAVHDRFSDDERRQILAIARTSNLYTKLVKSMAPNVFGHDKIKRGILLQLFGGVHKSTTSKQNLRGDINVCIVGDPSTSKSQFLKYVCEFVPRAVYTSGKASSAAGLTASVGRDPETGEFAIQAGALMLADNGICCIDEFDKMDITDQVAIHEAMEQQTISITKAGIQATLNARTSILAAANPRFGRYDDSHNLEWNVDMSAAIMSRFDLFFVVKDECDEVLDYNLARHIVNVHQENFVGVLNPEFTMQQLQLYIRYARTIKPKFDPDARQHFVRYYADLRSADATGHANAAYRITVRQLESMIRLAEARARLELSEVVTAKHVREAYDLLRTSIVHVDTTVDLGADEDWAMDSGVDEDQDGDQDDDMMGGGNSDDSDDAPRGLSSSDSDDGAPDSKSKSKAQAPAPAKQAPEAQAPKKASMKLSFEKYKSIANMIVLHFRSLEDDGEVTFSQQKVVDWFISENQKTGEVVTTEDAEAYIKLCVAIINRLVKKDHILNELVASPDPSKRMLCIHPNYNVEDDTTSHLDVKEKDRPTSVRKAASASAKQRKKPVRTPGKSPARKRKKADAHDSDDDADDETQAFEEMYQKNAPATPAPLTARRQTPLRSKPTVNKEEGKDAASPPRSLALSPATSPERTAMDEGVQQAKSPDKMDDDEPTGSVRLIRKKKKKKINTPTE